MAAVTSAAILSVALLVILSGRYRKRRSRWKSNHLIFSIGCGSFFLVLLLALVASAFTVLYSAEHAFFVDAVATWIVAFCCACICLGSLFAYFRG